MWSGRRGRCRFDMARRAYSWLGAKTPPVVLISLLPYGLALADATQDPGFARPLLDGLMNRAPPMRVKSPRAAVHR
jgi:hypothetical protein